MMDGRRCAAAVKTLGSATTRRRRLRGCAPERGSGRHAPSATRHHQSGSGRIMPGVYPAMLQKRWV
jgi:hypothetical protein